MTQPQSGQPGAHQSNTLSPESHALLHPKKAVTPEEHRGEVRDSGESDQHKAEQLGHVPAPKK
jgi:hypothetical protein